MLRDAVTYRPRRYARQTRGASIKKLKAEVKPEAVELILNSTSAVRYAGKDQNAESGSTFFPKEAAPSDPLRVRQGRSRRPEL
jgi:hypothetical protein